MNRMKTQHKIWLGIGIAALVLIFWFVGMYNSLVKKQLAVDNAWADVETQYQRRVDLIPNLVNTVKGYAAHEQKLFTEITELRSQWQNAKTVVARAEAAQGIESALARLLAVAENYPNLKANENFLSLQDELAGTENRVAVARNRYNDAVKTYNTKLRTFPSNMVAGMFGFTPKEFFQATTPGAEKAPTVSFT